MAQDNYDACFEHVLGSEGGYQNDPNDKGNWTGCAVGSGVNKGTNWGISACAYPDRDIRNLTQEQAKEIYRNDYWAPLQGDQLPYGVDLCTFDSGVNSGVYRGAQWLQRAVGAPVDGVVGAATLSATLAADDHVTVDRMCDDRLDYLRGLSTWDLYGKGWSSRVEDVRKTAHRMIDTQPTAKPVDETIITLTLRIIAKGQVIVEVES